jgi:hypothetical protein
MMKSNRKNHEKIIFTENIEATIWIPVRLLISISIIAFFTFLVVIGTQIGTENIQQNNFHNSMIEVKQSLESLYRHGDSRNLLDPINNPGSKRVYSITIPETINYVGFGRKNKDPDLLVSCIQYLSVKGSTFLWLDTSIELISGVKQNDVWYPNQNNTGFFLSSGSYYLIAELVSDNSHQFILMYNERK